MNISRCLFAGLLTWLSSCAPSIDAMSPAELMALDDRALCSAVAYGRERGVGSEFVEIERERRNLSCLAAIEEIVDDCSPLEIADNNPQTQYYPGPNGEYAYTVTLSITNKKSKPMDFSIFWKGRQVDFYTIRPNQTRDYTFISGLGSHDQMGRPLPDVGAYLRFCRVMSGFGG
ncbi:hypothetical protein [Brevundimonas sp.]|uniref:hypothetical protein n=1 Tax=Brevundimonas sp. TaxID=1871086 RepID=UPI0027301A33|nr:hypothetical protein [Brevundimonas sp.]